jgi:uncharacterized protein (DUF58 family)
MDTPPGEGAMIPPHVLRELRYLEIASSRRIRANRLGPYTSPSRGPGFDFDQHRPYRSGDDVRRIDWNVTARLNAPYLRETHAERELNVVMALDLSRSMDLGPEGRSKREAVTLITASLLFSAAADQINTGFLAFSDRVLTWSAPRRASGRAWAILESIWALEPKRSRTALLPALQHLSATLRHMTVIFLISDFLTDENLFDSKELRILAARHDVVAVMVEDPVETELPSGRGYMRVRDPESGAATTVALNGRTRRSYAEAVARRRQAFVEACYRVPIDWVFVRSDQPVTEPLLELFDRRRSG